MPIPRIAITTGEPAGIGPDVTLLAALRDWDGQLVAIGDADLLQQRAELLGIDVDLQPFTPDRAPARHEPGALAVCHVPTASAVTAGRLDPANSAYVLRTLREAVEGCQRHTFAAMVTAPVQKSVISDAGVPFSGHTEFLAQETGTPRVVMMLATEQLRVALATTHLPLQEVPAAITPGLLTETLHILHGDLVKKFAIEQPCIAVLGLNPHAGEGGHLGSEELEIIVPVLERLRGEGMSLLGPLPADTAFNPQVMEQVDAYLAMYHDQGLPVLKYAGFGNAINITLGLPVIRTSVDHGTALDLAGSGRASAGSMLQAITVALRLAQAGS